MRVVGIAVDMPSPGRPAGRLVVLVGDTADAAIEGAFDFPGDAVDLPTQLHSLSEAIRSRLTGLGVDRVVVRRADQAPVASNRDGPRFRLLAEGAIVSASRSVVHDTRIGTGKETGLWHGSDKAGVDNAARLLLSRDGTPDRYLEATSAALAALAIG